MSTRMTTKPAHVILTRQGLPRQIRHQVQPADRRVIGICSDLRQVQIAYRDGLAPGKVIAQFERNAFRALMQALIDCTPDHLVRQVRSEAAWDDAGRQYPHVDPDDDDCADDDDDWVDPDDDDCADA